MLTLAAQGRDWWEKGEEKTEEMRMKKKNACCGLFKTVNQGEHFYQKQQTHTIHQILWLSCLAIKT